MEASELQYCDCEPVDEFDGLQPLAGADRQAFDPDKPRGVVFIKRGTKSRDYWYAEWYDHAARIVRRRLGEAPTGRLYVIGGRSATNLPIATENQARVKALRVWEEAHSDYLTALIEKEAASEDAVYDMATIALFPREVVADLIQAITSRLTRRSHGALISSHDTGLKIFADKLVSYDGDGNARYSRRDYERILYDTRRITVSPSIVDKICSCFGMIYYDFIASALDWADKRGQWVDRPGGRDPWPVGYYESRAANDAIYWFGQ